MLNQADSAYDVIDSQRRPQLAQGSVFKSKQTRNMKSPDLKKMIENSEFNSYHMQANQDYKDKLKKELKQFIL